MNRTEALELLESGVRQNPGPWREHSLGVGRAAETIARAAGMDAERAYLSGLLHDIGRYAGPSGLRHAILGHDLMLEKGCRDIARICVTHSFITGRIEHFGGGALDVSEADLDRVRAIIALPFDDYDRLIQLCDALTWGEGVCLMEKRMVDVVLRHGTFPGMEEKWRRWFEIKADFESRIGHSLYRLFPECAEYTFDR